MRISAGQIRSTSEKTDNLRQIEIQVSEAASANTDLIVFPEFAMYEQPVLDRTYLASAESIGGSFTTALDAIARRYGVAVAAGMLERIDGADRAFNTTYVTDSTGTQVALYRKVHLYDAFGAQESTVIKASTDMSAVTFSLAGAAVGIMTCYDLRFPESARDLADSGASIIIVPALWAPGPLKVDHWNTLVRARAIENTVFVAAVTHAAPLSIGGSLIVDPAGEIVAQLGDGTMVETVELDLARVADVRAWNPSLENRRYSVQRSS